MSKGAVSSTPNAGSTKESGGDPSNHDDTLGAFWESEEDWEGADSSVMVGHPSTYTCI